MLGELSSRGLAFYDQIQHELLNQLGFDCRGEAIVGLLSLASIEQHGQPSLVKLFGQGLGMSRCQFQHLGYVRSRQQTTVKKRQEDRPYLQAILTRKHQTLLWVSQFDNHGLLRLA